LAAWSGWLAQHANLEVTLVIGNHDRRAGPFAGGGLSEVAEGWAIGPIACHHHPQEPGGIPSLAGHLHPTIRLVERCPCFWVQPDQIILPAFGAFTGGSFIEPRKGDEVIGIVEGQVFRQSNFHNNDYRNDNRAR
jgi:metallophosphoesterase superfamily enzyme